MKQGIAAGAFGCIVGLMPALIADIFLTQWEWWAMVMPVIAAGVVYANID